MVRVKDLVAGHDRHQILRVAQVDNVVRPAGDHVDALDLFPADLKLHRFAGRDVTLLNQPVAVHHDELLPLAVVPVLALGDAGLADIDAHLTAVSGMHQLCEAASVVAVHLHRVLELVRRQIAQIQAEQLLGKAAFRHLRHEQRRGLLLELLQQVDDLTQRSLVRHRDNAVAAICPQHRLQPVIFAVLLLSLQQVEHALHQIVDVQQLQLRAAVVDREGLVIRHRPAEGADRTVVLRAGMAHQVREAIDSDLRAGFRPVIKEQLLARLLAAAILAVIAANQRRLDGRGQHDRGLVAVLFQRIQQQRRKAEVALPEIRRVGGAVHSGKVEHEIGLGAEGIQFLLRVVDVILVDFINVDVRARAVLAVTDGFEVVAKCRSDHALRAGDQYIH